MAKARGGGLSPDRRFFFGAAGRSFHSARALASRISHSTGSRGGGGTANLLFPLIFSPTVLSVTPSSGLFSGGTVVDVAGMNFSNGATVTFGGVVATAVTFISPSHITCTTPAHARGAVNVTVTNPDLQSSTLVGGYTYTTAFLVAVGTNIVATSPDGLAWTLGTIPVSNHEALAYNGTVFAALSGNGNVYTSPDGLAWTFRQDIGASPGFPGEIVWNKGLSLFAATSTSIGKPLTSPTGATWTPATIAPFSGNAVGSNGTIFVTVGGSVALSSVDGATWVSRAFGVGSGIGVAWNGTVLVAICNSNQSKISTTGLAWSAGGAPGTAALVSIAWGPTPGVFAAVGLDVAATTPDGTTWTLQTMPAGNWTAVCQDGAKFVAVGLAGIVATSPDGVTWTLGTMAAGSWRAVASQLVLI